MHTKLFVLAFGDNAGAAKKAADKSIENNLIDKNGWEFDYHQACDESWETYAEFATPKLLTEKGVREQVVRRLILGQKRMVEKLADAIKEMRDGKDPEDFRLSFEMAVCDSVLTVYDATMYSARMVCSEDTLEHVEKYAKEEGKKLYVCVFDLHY